MLSNIIIHYFLLLAAAIVLIVVGLKYDYKTPAGHLVIDSLMLKIPIIGELLRKVAVARFCRTLGTLTSSGVPILEGMDITARTAGNMVVQNAILKSREAVEQGRNIAGPLAETKVFPPMVIQMVGVGEATGALDAMLSKVADFYEDEVDNAVAALTVHDGTHHHRRPGRHHRLHRHRHVSCPSSTSPTSSARTEGPGPGSAGPVRFLMGCLRDPAERKGNLADDSRSGPSFCEGGTHSFTASFPVPWGLRALHRNDPDENPETGLVGCGTRKPGTPRLARPKGPG